MMLIYPSVAWNSYEKYVNTTKGADYNSFRIELEKLGSTLNDLSIQLLVVDNDLAFFLDAPIPELRITLPKQGQTTEKFVSTLRTFYAQVKNDEYADLKYGDLPSWVMGSDKQNPGYSVYLVGWKDVEVCLIPDRVCKFAEPIPLDPRNRAQNEGLHGPGGEGTWTRTLRGQMFVLDQSLRNKVEEDEFTIQ